MAPQRLTPQQQSILQKASRNVVVTALEQMVSEFSRSDWLKLKNRYRQKTLARLKHDWSGNAPPKTTFRHSHLAEYVAASTLLHCLDGWGFLGRAIDGHIHGDSIAARHMAYYAELRAAMSILASEGIGVFNNDNFIVAQTGKCIRIPGKVGTHVITWLALEHWSTTQSASAMLANVIRPNGIPLSQWTNAVGNSASWRPVGELWLKSWGLDLLGFPEDRDARNEASYRPSEINSVDHLTTLEASDFLRQFWMIYEPSAPTRFDVLDRHLLRLGLENSYPVLTGRQRSRALIPKSVIKRMLGVMNIPGEHEWERFLRRDTDPQDPMILTEAAGTLSISSPRHHLQVISRAALLLRVATGMCLSLLQSANIVLADLSFWWRPLAETRGLWTPGEEPDLVTDLWEDIEAIIVDMASWETSQVGTVPSYRQWRNDQPRTVTSMSDCELIAFWGLGL